MAESTWPVRLVANGEINAVGDLTEEQIVAVTNLIEAYQQANELLALLEKEK